MKVISGTTGFETAGESAVTLGKFDGVHRGHQKLMQKIMAQKADGLQSIVFTFGQMPGAVLQGEKGRTILTAQERREHLRQLGIDLIIECPFTEELICMEPEHFVEKILVEKLHARYIAVGTDFRFGYERRGSCRLLQELADRYGYRTEIVEKECFSGQEISSSRVRAELAAGNMEMVEKLLGYPYYVTGTVVRGNQIGRTLGIPTANLTAADEKALPPNGVYLTKTLLDGREYFGITNIGVKPTISGVRAKGIENHLFDFTGDLYGKELKILFYAFRRGERRFASLTELREQLMKDAEWGRNQADR